MGATERRQGEDQRRQHAVEQRDAELRESQRRLNRDRQEMAEEAGDDERQGRAGRGRAMPTAAMIITCVR